MHCSEVLPRHRAASQESGTNGAIRMYGCTADASLRPLPFLALQVARVHSMVCQQVWQLEGQQFLDTLDIVPIGKNMNGYFHRRYFGRSDSRSVSQFFSFFENSAWARHLKENSQKLSGEISCEVASLQETVLWERYPIHIERQIQFLHSRALQACEITVA